MKLVKTPTYYVFHMYKCHQDATLVESSIETKQIGLQEQYMVPNLTQSVSVDKNGTLHITVTNLSADEGYDIEAEVSGRQIKEAEGEILTGDIRMGIHLTIRIRLRQSPLTVRRWEKRDFSSTFRRAVSYIWK